jgi:hypothetical protein
VPMIPVIVDVIAMGALVAFAVRRLRSARNRAGLLLLWAGLATTSQLGHPPNNPLDLMITYPLTYLLVWAVLFPVPALVIRGARLLYRGPS